MPSAHASLPPETLPDTPPEAAGETTLAAADQLLWHHACCWTARDECLIPGYTEITERCGTVPPAEEHHASFAFRVTPDRHGRPSASRIIPDQEKRHAVPGAFAARAHALLDQFEETVQATFPLFSRDLRLVRRFSSEPIDGGHCTVFRTERRSADLELEYHLWIDAHRGHAKRVDYRARARHAMTSGIAIAAASGSRHYRLTPADRWILTRQTERITFCSAAAQQPARGFAERTANYSEHWEPKPAN